MATPLVTAATLPYDIFSSSAQASSRRQEHASDWTTLLPLLRPSLKATQIPNGVGTLLLNTELVKSKTRTKILHVHIPGQISSVALDARAGNALAGVLFPGVDGNVEATACVAAGLLSSAGANEEDVVIAGRDEDVQGVTVREIEARVLLFLARDDAVVDHLLSLARLGLTAAGVKAFAEAKGSYTKWLVSDHKSNDGQVVLRRHDGVEVPFPGLKAWVDNEIGGLLDQVKNRHDTTVSIHLADINGLSRLEDYGLAKEIGDLLERNGIAFTLTHSTIVDHKDATRGLALSVRPIKSSLLSPQPKTAKRQAITSPDATPSAVDTPSGPVSYALTFQPSEITSRISSATSALIAAEPRITHYDTIVGDGDCGTTLANGAAQVQHFLSSLKSEEELTDFPHVLTDLVSDLEVNMGGTSGALYCIFLTALAGSLARESSWHAAAGKALEEMCLYTKARKGDRTMMDVLVPFIEGAIETGEWSEGLKKAEEGLKGTEEMNASLGRSAYLDESATKGVPDPGAYGLLTLLKALVLGEGK